MKIVIYEDSFGAILIRYEALLACHDVEVIFIEHFNILERKEQKGLEQKGFKLQKAAKLSEAPTPDADIYFVDGLSGNFHFILARLPRDKTYLVTGSERYCEIAERN